MGRGVSFRERDSYRPASVSPLQQPQPGNNSGVFNEQDKNEYIDVPIHQINAQSQLKNSSEIFIEQEKYEPIDVYVLSLISSTKEEDNDVSVFFEKDTDYTILGVNPITNNYPVNFPIPEEQTITDAILTTNGEYIAVGNNFYLKF